MQFFKVVTKDRKSLGLRNNPTILNFSVGEWTCSPVIKKGKSDDGGIWLAVSLSNAKRLVKYMLDHHGIKCRIFASTVGQILFKNSYRIKTDKIRCDVEIK